MKNAIAAVLLVAAVIVNTNAQTAAANMPPIGPGVSQELARWRAAHYSDVRYKLNLTLEKMSPLLKGTIEIRVNVKGSPPYEGGVAEGRGGSPIVLDWRKIRGHEDKSTISNVSINGKPAIVAPPEEPAVADEGVRVPWENEHLVFRDGVVAGENVIKLDFTSPILTSGSAITRYVDKEDGSEYIYSLFVPSDASTAFPVFDQPDLKARFTLQMEGPGEWKFVSNAVAECSSGLEVTNSKSNLKPATTSKQSIDPEVSKALRNLDWQKIGRGCGLRSSNLSRAYGEFFETKPISTYVFAFAAGPWEKVSEPPASAGGQSVRPANWPAAYAAGSDLLPTDGYIRKSQADKFKPHAAEVFRLNREAIKYFEEYFNYKFPWPKYDLVLIPEFPFGGMEHAGATFLRESSIIFPQEPTKNDHISRALLIFHEASHQWFGDTVTMRWFDDLWLKEGFATFTAYKAMERVMPEMLAWKVFYERVKQAAYQTDSTRGTTAIYQPIANLSAAKSAYGNIVYNKAPAFLRQAEFYLGEDKFQTAVRAFLKKHEFGNATWEELVAEFEAASKQDLQQWAQEWVKRPGLYQLRPRSIWSNANWPQSILSIDVTDGKESKVTSQMRVKALLIQNDHSRHVEDIQITPRIDPISKELVNKDLVQLQYLPIFAFPNYQDYGYGIFLLDAKSRDYVRKNIQNEKDPFLRSMMWGALWDSVREGELDPREYVELVVKVLSSPNSENHPVGETPTPLLRKEGSLLGEDESTTALLLNRVGTAMNYYLSEPPASAGGQFGRSANWPAANAAGSDKADLRTRVEDLLIERMHDAPTLGQRITYYRAFLNVAASENARGVLKGMLTAETQRRVDVKSRLNEAFRAPKDDVSYRVDKEEDDRRKSSEASGSSPTLNGRVDIPLKTKDKFDIVTRLLILGDPEAPKLLAELEKTETGDDAKRYAYAAKAGIPTAENKAKYWNDFVNNKEISESWIEAAFGPWNSIRHSELTLPYLERALKELPNHKRNRKIFFVNGWLGAFIGGQRSEEALGIINKFLAENPTLDNDLRLKILENADVIERAVKIRAKYGR